MDLSYQEKSLWLLFVSLVGVFGFYFATVLPMEAAHVMPQQMFLFGAAVAALVVAQIVGHIAIALVDRRTETDERDLLIELKSTRNAAYVLATGVFLSLCTALATDGNFVFTHLLLAFWVLAQLVQVGSQLVMLRRGA